MLGDTEGSLENEGQVSRSKRGQEYAREWLNQYIPALSLGTYCPQYSNFSEDPRNLAGMQKERNNMKYWTLLPKRFFWWWGENGQCGPNQKTWGMR